MSTGELLTRSTIWISIVAYAAGVATFALPRKKDKDEVTRLAWTVAFVSLLAHVAFAFHFYHSWSHTEAYRDTARQTYEIFGWNWGGGLYINYVLLIGWLADIAWWWLGGIDSYRRRPWVLIAAWHGFLIFIIFNATAIFETDWVRWVGTFVCLGICLLWWRAAQNNSHRKPLKYWTTGD